MFGNWATGKLAMTMATMGRLMKKLDMDVDSFRSNSGSSALASSGRKARGRSPGYAGVLASTTLVAFVPLPLFAFIESQMAWVVRSYPGGESAGLARPHVHQVSVRPG